MNGVGQHNKNEGSGKIISTIVSNQLTEDTKKSAIDDTSEIEGPLKTSYALAFSVLTEGAASVVCLSASLVFGEELASELVGRASSPEKTVGSYVSVRVGWKSANESPLLVGDVSIKKEVGLKGFPLAWFDGKGSFSAASMLEVVGVFNPSIP